MLCFAIQSIAQMPTSEDWSQRRPDETLEEYFERTNDVIREASAEGIRQATEFNENYRRRKENRRRYLIPIAVVGVLLISGCVTLVIYLQNRHLRE
jgi:hypothetical protein